MMATTVHATPCMSKTRHCLARCSMAVWLSQGMSNSASTESPPTHTPLPAASSAFQKTATMFMLVCPCMPVASWLLSAWLPQWHGTRSSAKSPARFRPGQASHGPCSMRIESTTKVLTKRVIEVLKNLLVPCSPSLSVGTSLQTHSRVHVRTPPLRQCALCLSAEVQKKASKHVQMRLHMPHMGRIRSNTAGLVAVHRHQANLTGACMTVFARLKTRCMTALPQCMLSAA